MNAIYTGKRMRLLNFRVTAEQYENVRILAGVDGKGISSFLRDIVMREIGARANQLIDTEAKK